MNDPSVNLSLTVSEEPDAAVLAPNGELDYFTSALFTGRLADLIALDRPRIVIDMSGVGFCDSVGIAALVQAKRDADRRGTDLLLRDLQPTVHRALSITGLDPTLPLSGTGDGTSGSAIR